MGFKVVTITTVRYSGQPSNGQAKVRIRLEDGTELIATDGWHAYPTMALQLHPDHFPRQVLTARHALLQQLQGERGVDPNEIVARLPRNLAVGDLRVPVVVRHGNWAKPLQTVTFNSKVVRLEVVS